MWRLDGYATDMLISPGLVEDDSLEADDRSDEDMANARLEGAAATRDGSFSSSLGGVSTMVGVWAADILGDVVTPVTEGGVSNPLAARPSRSYSR